MNLRLIQHYSTGIYLKKSLGQHFLKDKRVLERIVNSANKIKEDDVVLEIGPGSGLLTQYLLNKPIRVIAVEKDLSLIPLLEQKFKSHLTSGQLSIISGDALTIPLPSYTCCIANIPYYISSQLLQRFVIENRVTQEYLLLVQKEFCSKLCIDTEQSDHESTFLTVFLQSYFSISRVFDVSPRSFSPPPKVVSSLMRLTPLPSQSSSLSHVQNPIEYGRFLKSLYSTKNKTLQQTFNRVCPGQSFPLPIDNRKKVYQLSTKECCTLFDSF